MLEAAIIRNGGGRTVDAIRSILDLDSIGTTGTIIVIHHTGKLLSLSKTGILS